MTLWVGQQEGHTACKNCAVGCWCGICLEQGADLYMAQRMPLPLTVSCFSKIQIGFSFLVPAHPGSTGQRAIKRVCVCVNQLTDIQLINLLRFNCSVVVYIIMRYTAVQISAAYSAYQGRI